LIPEREVLNHLARDEYAPVLAEHRVYFRDVYDHVVRVHDIMETQRDLISGALDTYLSAISNRTNDIMKTLTLVTVMFLPMSFVAGFFGMNFFGETLAFQSPLPTRLLFTIACLMMVVPSWAMYLWAWHRGWFEHYNAEERRAREGRDGVKIGAGYNPIEED
jgi:magnesium transporter